LKNATNRWKKKTYRSRMLVARNCVTCEIGNTFSEVVICRRLRPAGGQPFFQAFFRLPDRNLLKRLEAFFRVISSRRGALHPARFICRRCKTHSTDFSSPRPGATGIVLRARESLASRETPSLTKIMQRKTHPSLSLPSFATILRSPLSPLFAPSLSRVVIFIPSTR